MKPTRRRAVDAPETFVIGRRSDSARPPAADAGRLGLTRKVGQSVIIGDAEVLITALGTESVQIAVIAPRSVRIVRREMLDGGAK